MCCLTGTFVLYATLIFEIRVFGKSHNFIFNAANVLGIKRKQERLSKYHGSTGLHSG